MSEGYVTVSVLVISGKHEEREWLSSLLSNKFFGLDITCIDSVDILASTLVRRHFDSIIFPLPDNPRLVRNAILSIRKITATPIVAVSPQSTSQVAFEVLAAGSVRIVDFADTKELESKMASVLIESVAQHRHNNQFDASTTERLDAIYRVVNEIHISQSSFSVALAEVEKRASNAERLAQDTREIVDKYETTISTTKKYFRNGVIWTGITVVGAVLAQVASTLARIFF